MIRQQKILGMIPARKGSKGLPNKNIKIMAGSPLIAWTAQTLLNVDSVDTKICSTDSIRVAKICETIGLAVPFMRPKALATDEAPVSDVVRHAINFYLEQQEVFSHVLLLQATSPTVTSADIETAIKVGIETDADTVISCYKLTNEHPSLMYYCNGELLSAIDSRLQSIRRQDQPEVLVRTGLLYLIKVSSFLDTGEIIGKKIAHVDIDEQRSIAIDTIDDWIKCENYLREL